MLKLSKIQKKPKKVEKAKSFRIGVKLTAAQKANIDEIIDAISAGTELPSWAYRSKLKITDDKLLQEAGIMHLHIGAANSKELLYVVQYDESVLMLEISSHAALEDEPRGTILHQLHQATLKKFEGEEAEALKLAATASLPAAPDHGDESRT